MLIEAVLRAAHILRAQPGHTMPLSQLHAQLVQELGSEAGSYTQIYQQLVRRTDSFAILNAPRVLPGAEGWAGMVREAYDAALENAGLGACVRVALTEPPGAEMRCDVAAALNATVGELVSICGKDVTLAHCIDQATLELAAVTRALNAQTERPTTLPPGLPPAG